MHSFLKMLGRVVNQTRLVLNNIHYAKFIVQSKHRSISNSCSRLSSNRIGFVGTGKIAQAIISGLIKKNIFKPEQIYVSDANKEYLKHLKEKSSLFQVNFRFLVLNIIFIDESTFYVSEK